MIATEEPLKTMEEVRAEAEEQGYRYCYGSLFPPNYNSRGQMVGPMQDWQIEAHCLRADKPWAEYTHVLEGEKPMEYQGYVAHFMAFVSALWPTFEWNPNSVKIIKELFVEGRQFLGVAGHGSSSKTETLAYAAVAFFLIDPRNTMCIVTSKTVEIAQKKIWGSVRRAWNQLKTVIKEKDLPGELTMKAITYIDITTGDQDPQRGLMLMPGEQSQYRKSADKYQGMKAPNLMVAADELATLSPAIVETAISNLTKGATRMFKFVGSFNPETHHDASRKVAMPKAGWGSITVNDMEWETELGYCIRFDGLKSPNVLDGKATWTGLYTREMLEKDLVHYHGEKTAGFWTMVRGFWPPMGIEDAIYSSQEIETHRGEWMEEKGFHWLEAPIRCAGLDPSYRPGGDRAVLYFGQCGLASFDDKRVQMVFQFGDPLGPQISPGYLILAEDVTKAQDKSRQVAEALKCECEKRSIRIENVGIDVTGAASFGSLVRMVWGDGFLEIDFSQSASETPISATDPMPSNERYADKPSELWYSGKYLLWTEQLKGISPDLAQEMVSRSFTESGGKIKIEPKDKMKLRIGKSPDISDGAFCCLDVARQRLNLVSNAQNTKTKEQEKAGEEDGFTGWARRMGLQGASIQSLVYES